ncbi:MAG: hypothetical protein PHG03_05710 [Bacilli bacterium]|nr:hypothetical protein [Bacilli bacterium]MDD4796028.1 hypothetical protein [Bacilli bacterium]
MKLKYQTLTKEKQLKIKKQFLKSKDSLVYQKANRLFTVAVIGIIIAIISSAFDLIYKTGTINYIIDIFLFIFSLIFIIIMRKIKLKEINNYVVKKP